MVYIVIYYIYVLQWVVSANWTTSGRLEIGAHVRVVERFNMKYVRRGFVFYFVGKFDAPLSVIIKQLIRHMSNTKCNRNGFRTIRSIPE